MLHAPQVHVHCCAFWDQVWAQLQQKSGTSGEPADPVKYMRHGQQLEGWLSLQ